MSKRRLKKALPTERPKVDLDRWPRYLRGPTGSVTLIFCPIERLIAEHCTNAGVRYGQRLAASIIAGVERLEREAALAQKMARSERLLAMSKRIAPTTAPLVIRPDGAR